MRYLSIDIETYSDVDLSKSGVYKYAESKEFKLLLIAYSVDFGEVEIFDYAAGEVPPKWFFRALIDPKVIKTAFNANFEMVCLGQALFNDYTQYINRYADQWHCTMVKAHELRLFGGLASVGAQLGLSTDHLKNKKGKDLIRLFSKPNKKGEQVQYFERYAEWQDFKNYCMQDVRAENAIFEELKNIKLPQSEHKLWAVDQKINCRGIKIDTQFANAAIKAAEADSNTLLSRARELTGLSNPNSVPQLKNWIKERTGQELDSLNKVAVKELIKSTKDESLREVLTIRQQLGKTSITKYQRMLDCACSDDRARGLLQFYGAGTGRWAGRLIQVHNLPRNSLTASQLDLARQLVLENNTELLELLVGDTADILSQLIRTAFIPDQDDHVFVISDFSAIEARVLAWLAGEHWRLDIFNSHGKIYEASAAMMYKVPIESIAHGKENYHMRQKGKVAELALGYQGSIGAMKAMGADKLGLSDEELLEIVNNWRTASPNIVRLWYELERAAIQAIKGNTYDSPTPHRALIDKLKLRIVRSKSNQFLAITLPSGRAIYYPNPRVVEDDYGREKIEFVGLTQTTQKIERQTTYGGKLVENVVQAIARDCLAESLKIFAPYCCMHVHDEVILSVSNAEINNLDIDRMNQPIAWAPDLPLNAESFTANYYRKE